jgi:HlyD family secretion protein
MKINLTVRKWLMLGAAVVLVIIFAAFALNHKKPAAYFTEKVDRGDIRDVVQATGTINAVTTVQVGSQVSGTISQLFADFNSRVKKGQVIARIDPSLFEGALLQARADFENAKANLAASQANLEKAKASALQARQDYDRTRGLTSEGIMSEQQLDLAKATSDSGQAAVSAAQAQVDQARAQTQQKSAAVTVAKTNLDYTIITAPVEGIVVARSVDVGQTVAASLQAPTLFTIAQDLTKMQVYAKTDESDVGQIKAGQKATFRVDAFPKQTFTGHVVQVRMNPTTVQNVVTYDTIVEFDNPEMKLFPGMTAYVDIPVAVANNVVKIPNGALRFKPSLPADEVARLYQQNGIKAGRARGASAASGQADAANAEGVRRWQQRQQQQQQQRQQQQGEETPGGGAQPKPEMREVSPDVAIVWKLLPDKSIAPVQVRTGITDHTYTELKQVLAGGVEAGEQLVIGNADINKPATGARAPGIGGGVPRR